MEKKTNSNKIEKSKIFKKKIKEHLLRDKPSIKPFIYSIPQREISVENLLLNIDKTKLNNNDNYKIEISSVLNSEKNENSNNIENNNIPNQEEKKKTYYLEEKYISHYKEDKGLINFNLNDFINDQDEYITEESLEEV